MTGDMFGAAITLIAIVLYVFYREMKFWEHILK